MSVSVFILNFAYVGLIAAGFTRQLTWLRTMLVIAAIGFVAYGAIETIWSMVVWNSAIGTLHVSRIVRDVRQQRSVRLDAEERSIRDDFFPGVTDFDFHVLWSMGSQAEFCDEVIIERGSRPSFVSLVTAGTALIEENGRVDRGVRRGGLLGEMSFVSNRPADVDVRAQGRVQVHQWDQRELAAMDQVHPASARAFRSLMERDLVAKARI